MGGRVTAVNVDEFWGIVEAARADGRPFHEALEDRLAERSEEEILAFQTCSDKVRGTVYRWDVWAAAYLIGGGCSDDSFMDFREGLIALGREWFERVARSPDDLVEHPAVIRAAADGGYPVFYEVAGYAAAKAYERVTGKETCDFYDAVDEYRAAHGIEERESGMGEAFDFGDAAEMRRRLPRLAELFLPG
ncbi:DUF4240 domain-containing protein [Thermomonospora cellulosilytica]|uniref:DUF4240 domain-containing protein n=1 Tax=Thermomonospora cellulosilytica TaxID=1411118 RepID=A0A7W3MUZ9_9ACTN|nr:DUF4240 domain-containing protein [Thermomonospora cellulosilytica]MBA9002364.1 hypothetical protein [Thermomonospora cellulosilytica]